MLSDEERDRLRLMLEKERHETIHDMDPFPWRSKLWHDAGVAWDTRSMLDLGTLDDRSLDLRCRSLNASMREAAKLERVRREALS